MRSPKCLHTFLGKVKILEHVACKHCSDQTQKATLDNKDHDHIIIV
uniref:Uncharacterized protein n=1 Tax=Arundo donax TaxID=35708 RepID=A0A0A9FJM3_ARUDO